MPDVMLTDELLSELLTSDSVQSFFESNTLPPMSLSLYLNALLEEKGLDKRSVIKASRLNETYAYQIFSGDRHPSRDKVLQLAFAMNLKLLEVQRMLKYAGVSELYCKNRRDAIVLFCFEQELTLCETDDELYAFGEATINGFGSKL